MEGVDTGLMIAENIAMLALMCVMGLSVLAVTGLLLNALMLMAVIFRELLEDLFRKEKRNP